MTRLVRVEHVRRQRGGAGAGAPQERAGRHDRLRPRQSALIITDLASNINRMMRILREIDQPGAGREGLDRPRQEHGRDARWRRSWREIFQVAAARQDAQGAAPPAQGGQVEVGRSDHGDDRSRKIIPDERSNQLIIIATERAYARVLTLVKKLDVAHRGRRRAHPRLLLRERELRRAGGRRWAPSPGVTVTGGHAAVRGAPWRAAASPRPPARAAGGGRNAGTRTSCSRATSAISFDRPTNSLIIVSSLKDYQAVRRVIERLDSPRKQVFVEAMIMEVTLDKQRGPRARRSTAASPSACSAQRQSLVAGWLQRRARP